MMKLTNKPEDVITSSSNFAAFLEEGLAYINYSTPTYINSGGCGHFAYLLSEQLDKHEIPYKIIAIYTDCKGEGKELKNNTIDYLRNNKRDISTEEIGASHIIILIDNSIYIDSEGIENVSFYMHRSDFFEITRDELALLNEIDCWNPLFDKKCIPIIKSCLEKVFEKMEDFHTGIFHLERLTHIKLTSHTVKEKMKQLHHSPLAMFGL